MGRGSSLSLICSCFCETNDLTSHLPGIYPPLTKCMDGERVLNIRVSVAYDKSVCTPASVPFARNKPSILHMQRVRMSSKAESTRREVYLGCEEGKSAPLTARCLNIPTHLPPLCSEYRYAWQVQVWTLAAAASEINGCVKGDDPQLMWSCLTLLPVVAGPGCCIPGELLQFFRRNLVRL